VHYQFTNITKNIPQAQYRSQTVLYNQLQKNLKDINHRASKNLDWLWENLPPYFFITMKEEPEVIQGLALNLDQVANQCWVTLINQDKKLILARLDKPGSLYDTLKNIQERPISYAEVTHSFTSLPNTKFNLEIQRFEFDLKTKIKVAGMDAYVDIPTSLKKAVKAKIKHLYRGFDFHHFDDQLHLLWLNNKSYVQVSPPERIARLLWLYQQCITHQGLYLDVEETESASQKESRLMFSVGNPPQKGFLGQVLEVLQRLDIGVRRFYCLSLNNSIHPYFLGNFYLISRQGQFLEKGSKLFNKLQSELYNTQILTPTCTAYKVFVADRIMSGEEASLINAFIAFCHTTLAHNQPDRFGLDIIKNVFHAHPEMVLSLIRLFRERFNPHIDIIEENYEQSQLSIKRKITEFNTGNKHLDEISRTVFNTCLLFIKYTLKTNFFVREKHAISFRLDPTYLSELPPEIIEDLPIERPFRITFFFSRHSTGYHIGFSDIARGGWRTIISRTEEEHTTNVNNLFREVYVLAHTQHLKNKDIYEGGSKLTVVLDACDLGSDLEINPRLYKAQFGIINAFLDIFVTEKGQAKHPHVIDYYGSDEAIELGPDENMHDVMIELIARESVKRGYVLGIGIISSKKVGINHKEYGVTSRGVIKAATIAMAQIGRNILTDPFTVKFTGGPFGDVAGNCMRLLLDRCIHAEIISIIDGLGALYDPQGTDHAELNRIVLKNDVVDFDPQKLHVGGFVLFRHERKQEGFRELYRKVIRTDSGLQEQWITLDEFQRHIENLIFTVSADLFLPCGGRPETVDESNWSKLFSKDDQPNVTVIVEGANSFISPEARVQIQKKGVIIIRDSSANKCGVISSSYEILANLLMNEKEFVKDKEAYVGDVLGILEKRAENETNLIFKKYRKTSGTKLYTEISSEISAEINSYYGKLFTFFQKHPKLTEQPLYRKVIFKHLPNFIYQNPKYRSRVSKLPLKIKCAILASEIASFIVYHGGWESDLEGQLKHYLHNHII